jgi:hypothetical protein
MRTAHDLQQSGHALGQRLRRAVRVQVCPLQGAQIGSGRVDWNKRFSQRAADMSEECPEE